MSSQVETMSVDSSAVKAAAQTSEPLSRESSSQLKRETPRIAKILLDGEIKSRLEGTERTIRERGAKDVTLSQIAEKIILAADPKTLEGIIEEFTPFEFRLKSALQDEKKRAQIMRILNAKPDRASGRTSDEDLQEFT